MKSKSVFYKMPKALFTDERYATISADAKMLYMMLLDRTSLSKKNKLYNRQGRVYIFFTVEQACELLHFGKGKVCRLFAELEAAELIMRKKQGQGKAAVIYVTEV